MSSRGSYRPSSRPITPVRVRGDLESQPLLGGSVGNRSRRSSLGSNAGGGPVSSGRAAKAAKAAKRSLYVVLLTVFLGSAMYTIVLPSMPEYIEQLHAKAYVLGWLVSAFSVGQFLFSPPLGSWMNRRNALEPLLFAGVLLVLGNTLYSIGWNKWVLLGARFIIGAGAANVSVCRAYAAAITPGPERTAVFSLIAAAQGVGFVMGPAMGSVLSSVDYKIRVGGSLYPDGEYHLNSATAPGWLSVLLCIINLLAISLFFTDVSKDPALRARIEVAATARKPSDAALGKTVNPDSDDDRLYSPEAVPDVLPKRPKTPTTAVPQPLPLDAIPERSCCTGVDKSLDGVALGIAMTVFFLVITLFSIFETILSKIVKELYGWKARNSGILFMCCGVVSIFAFASIGPINKFVQDRLMLVTGLCICFAAGAICFNLNDDIPLWRFLIGQGFFSIGYPISSALIYAMFSKILGDTDQGTMMGMLTSAGSMARTLGPLAAGYTYYYEGSVAVYMMISGVSLLALSVVFLGWKKLLPFDVLFDRKLAKYLSPQDQQARARHSLRTPTVRAPSVQ